MGNAGTPTQKHETKEIPKSQWLTFLATFTQENRGAHALLKVLGPDVGYQVETGDRPFAGVAADVRKADENAIWITLGDLPDNHMTHGVHNVKVIHALPIDGETGAVLEIEANDGTKTILELSRPDAYALPPAAKKERKS
jgi:hypothetical protein